METIHTHLSVLRRRHSSPITSAAKRHSLLSYLLFAYIFIQSCIIPSISAIKLENNQFYFFSSQYIYLTSPVFGFDDSGSATYSIKNYLFDFANSTSRNTGGLPLNVESNDTKIENSNNINVLRKALSRNTTEIEALTGFSLISLDLFAATLCPWNSIGDIVKIDFNAILAESNPGNDNVKPSDNDTTTFIKPNDARKNLCRRSVLPPSCLPLDIFSFDGDYDKALSASKVINDKGEWVLVFLKCQKGLRVVGELDASLTNPFYSLPHLTPLLVNSMSAWLFFVVLWMSLFICYTVYFKRIFKQQQRDHPSLPLTRRILLLPKYFLLLFAIVICQCVYTSSEFSGLVLYGVFGTEFIGIYAVSRITFLIPIGLFYYTLQLVSKGYTIHRQKLLQVEQRTMVSASVFISIALTFFMNVTTSFSAVLSSPNSQSSSSINYSSLPSFIRSLSLFLCMVLFTFQIFWYLFWQVNWSLVRIEEYLLDLVEPSTTPTSRLSQTQPKPDAIASLTQVVNATSTAAKSYFSTKELQTISNELNHLSQYSQTLQTSTRFLSNLELLASRSQRMLFAPIKVIFREVFVFAFGWVWARKCNTLTRSDKMGVSSVDKSQHVSNLLVLYYLQKHWFLRRFQRVVLPVLFIGHLVLLGLSINSGRVWHWAFVVLQTMSWSVATLGWWLLWNEGRKMKMVVKAKK